MAVLHLRGRYGTLLQRAESLPSNSDSQANEREYVLNVLGENNYPKRFLDDCLRPPVCRNQNNSEAEGDTSVKGFASLDLGLLVLCTFFNIQRFFT